MTTSQPSPEKPFAYPLAPLPATAQLAPMARSTQLPHRFFTDTPARGSEERVAPDLQTHPHRPSDPSPPTSAVARPQLNPHS